MKRLLIDTTPIRLSIVESTDSSGPLRMRGVFQKSDVTNANKRIYPRSIWERTLKRSDILESLRNKRMVGEVDHPNESEPKLKHASHIITDLVLQENGIVEGELEILPTEYGKHLESLLRSGVEVGVSSRGMGSTHVKDGVEYIGEDYELLTFDVVASPSTPGAYPKLVESKQVNNEEEKTKMTPNEKFRNLKESANRLLDTNPSRMSASHREAFVNEADSIVEQLDRLVVEDTGFRSSATNIVNRLQEASDFITSIQAPPTLEEQLDAAVSVIEEMSRQMQLREKKVVRIASNRIRGIGERVVRMNSRNRKLRMENIRLANENRVALAAGDELLFQFKKVHESKRRLTSRRVVTESSGSKSSDLKKKPSLAERIISSKERRILRPPTLTEETDGKSSKGSVQIAEAMISTIGGI